MSSISDVQKKYSSKLDVLDLELLIAAAIHRPREFVLAHPEKTITKNQETKIKKNIARRMKCEPLAYILGHREFFGLDFAVDKHTLVPRPETETLVELASYNIQQTTCNKKENETTIIDVGTGSGNIIISLAHTLDSRLRGNDKIKYFATDISKDALKIAKYNAKKNKVDKKIKFLQSDLISKLNKKYFHNLIIVANLPYLSPKIYSEAPLDVKKYEPKSALFSNKEGLAHYEKLLTQIKKLVATCCMLHAICYMEISPKQKKPTEKLVKKYFPKAKPIFHKDLAGKWRVCEVKL